MTNSPPSFLRQENCPRMTYHAIVKRCSVYVRNYSKKGSSELYDHLRDFSVIEEDNNKGVIIGVCALGVCWEEIGEIRSLAIKESYQQKDLGTMLVNECMKEAKNLGLKKVFTLTYVPDFFIKMGFN